MKKAKKIVALLLCAVLLVGASIAGTVAYLTDKEDVVNTFTVGNIDIKLDEANTATDDADDRTEEGNAYHLLPNQTYTKDPTVWVKEGSEEAYIRLVVTVANYDNMLKAFQSDATYDDNYIVTAAPDVEVSGNMVVLDNLVDRNAGAWQCVKFTEDAAAKTGTYVFNYYPGTYTATADDKDDVVEYDELPALFTTISVPWQIDNEHLAYLNNTTITVTAQAMQAAGFNNAADAWAAFPANAPVNS